MILFQLNLRAYKMSNKILNAKEYTGSVINARKMSNEILNAKEYTGSSIVIRDAQNTESKIRHTIRIIPAARLEV